MAINYFYDGQLRRYKEQFGRVFSTIQYTSGYDAKGKPILSKVPCVPASADLQAMNIMMNNSENTIPSLPMFAYYITNVSPAPERRQAPHFVRELGVTYRQIDKMTGKYNSQIGNEYLVENYMPVPYNVTFRLDLWFTSDLNREEIAEQIMTYFNPMIDIQTNRNILDWSSLTVIEMLDMNWNPLVYGTTTAPTTRTMSWNFNVPVWINPPSKVKKSNKINEIIISIGEGDPDFMVENESDPFTKLFDDSTLLNRSVVTPGNFNIMVKRNYNEAYSYYVKLMVDQNNTTDENNVPWDWNVLLQKYGNIEANVSNLLLMTDIDNLDHNTDYNNSSYDDSNHMKIIAGTISVNKNDATILNYTIDPSTTPQNYNKTYYIDRCIDPFKTEPFDGMGENCNKDGITYLILNTIPQGSLLWGTIYENGSPITTIDGAVQNDILQFDGTKWNKIFNSVDNKSSLSYAQSNCNGDFFTFQNGWWHLTIDGEYHPGYWRIRL